MPWCTLKTARTPLFDDALPTTVRAPHPKLCPSQIGVFFLPQPVLLTHYIYIYIYIYIQSANFYDKLPYRLYTLTKLVTPWRWPGYMVKTHTSFACFRLLPQSSWELCSSGLLRKGLIHCPERSVRNYHCLLRNNPEEHSSLVGALYNKYKNTMQLDGNKFVCIRLLQRCTSSNTKDLLLNSSAGKKELKVQL